MHGEKAVAKDVILDVHRAYMRLVGFVATFLEAGDISHSLRVLVLSADTAVLASVEPIPAIAPNNFQRQRGIKPFPFRLARIAPHHALLYALQNSYHGQDHWKDFWLEEIFLTRRHAVILPEHGYMELPPVCSHFRRDVPCLTRNGIHFPIIEVPHGAVLNAERLYPCTFSTEVFAWLKLVMRKNLETTPF